MDEDHETQAEREERIQDREDLRDYVDTQSDL